MDVMWIKQELERTGKTQVGLADYLGLHPSAVNRLLKGERKLQLTEVEKIRDYLDSKIALNGKPQTPTATATNTGKIPVLGSAEAGEDGSFPWNGEIVERVDAPPALVGVAGAYAIYVYGSSMEPRYQSGEKAYIHPGKPVQAGNFVVVQTKPRHEGDAPRAFVKRLAKRSGRKYVLEQLNPHKTFEVSSDDVTSIHKIVASSE